MTALKSYSSYKPSGVEWLGDIPVGWGMVKFSRYYKSGMGNTILASEVQPEGKIPVLSATELYTYFGYIEKAAVILGTNDFVIPARGNSIGHVKLVREKCTTTQTTIYCKALGKNGFDAKYVYYYLIGNKKNLFYFVQTAIPQITVEEVSSNPILLPSPTEQTRIAAFLDVECGKIDALITKSEQMIALLDEKRHAVITHYVTKGTNPTAHLKPSGINWLGNIPEGWKHVSLRWISKIYSGGTPDKSNLSYWSEGTIPWLNSGAVNQFNITTPSNYITEEALKKSSAKWVAAGSILMALAGQGKTKGMVGITEIKTTCNQSMAAIELNKGFNKFILYYLHSKYKDIRGLSSSDGRDGLNLEMLGDIKCPFPSVEEQKQIVQSIETKTAKIDALKTKIITQLELLKERKTSLITAAVTGKIDVRNYHIQQEAA